ncbi:ABC transporter permease subunit [candidate division FCPU426 bacterium]|nr:ABC transporter permease subunit [candidate division FCPU426 bacterium]
MCGREAAGFFPTIFGRRTWFASGVCAFAVLLLMAFAWLFISGSRLTSWEGFASLSRQPWFWRSVKLTLYTALATTALAAVLGVPAAYALSRFDFPGKKAAEVVFLSLLVLPASSVGLMLMVALQYPPVRLLQDSLHIRIVHSLPGVVVAQLVLALAFGVVAWRVAFDQIHPVYEHVGRTLGASSGRVFFNLTLPMAGKGILTGAILAFSRAMAEFGAVLILCSTFRFRDPGRFSAVSKFLGIDRADILAVAMWMEMEEGQMERGMALAFIMLGLTAVFVYVLIKMKKRAFHEYTGS